MKSILLGLVAIIAAATLAGCAGTTTPIGTASARQQTLSVSLTIEGPLPAGSTVPLISIGTVSYDGTRGDIAKNKAGGAIQDDDTVTIPLPQAAGASVASSVLSKLYTMAAGDKAETVPAAFSGMSLADWKLLKASYLECPECLALTPEEEAALKAATGK
ncbi:MAG: hypothetical protein GX617_15835 [Lentisphaerae bacterium]|nr:hypothetical protein [Lentisphaerota bacterium]